MKKLAAVALLMLFVLPVFAQERVERPDKPDLHWKMATAQINASLALTHDGVKTQTLKNAIILATLYRDKVDMSKSVRALRIEFEESDNASHRKLALAALQAVGINRTSRYLARHTTEAESEEGRMMVASVLNDYYLLHVGAP